MTTPSGCGPARAPLRRRAAEPRERRARPGRRADRRTAPATAGAPRERRETACSTCGPGHVRPRQTVPVSSASGVVALPPHAAYPWVAAESDADGARRKGGKRAPSSSHGWFATVGSGGSMRVWDVQRGQCVWEHRIAPLAGGGAQREAGDEGEPPAPLVELSALASSSLLAGGDARALLCAVRSDYVMAFVEWPRFVPGKQLIGHNEEITDMRFCGADGAMLAVTTNSPELRVYGRASWDGHLLHGHDDVILSVDATHDGALLATGSKARGGLASAACRTRRPSSSPTRARDRTRPCGCGHWPMRAGRSAPRRWPGAAAIRRRSSPWRGRGAAMTLS